MARELSRQVMNLRKEIRLTPQDAVILKLASQDQGMRDTLEELFPSFRQAVNATVADVGDALPDGLDAKTDFELDGQPIAVGIKRI